MNRIKGSPMPFSIAFSYCKIFKVQSSLFIFVGLRHPTLPPTWILKNNLPFVNQLLNGKATPKVSKLTFLILNNALILKKWYWGRNHTISQGNGGGGFWGPNLAWKQIYLLLFEAIKVKIQKEVPVRAYNTKITYWETSWLQDLGFIYKI